MLTNSLATKTQSSTLKKKISSQPKKFSWSRVWHICQTWANQHEWLFLLWLLVIILRLPSLSEPYWYGDEAIYLTIGNALKFGQRLYLEIVDHKTPLIYYFASVPNQLWFRLLMSVWMLASSYLFWRLANKLFPSLKVALFSSVLFVFLSNVSFMEGNVPNGELFVIGFVLAGLYFLSKTTFFNNWLQAESRSLTSKDLWLSFVAGLMFGGGVMTKVPGIFDAIAGASIFAWLSLPGLWLLISPRSFRTPPLKQTILGGLIFVAGLLSPLILFTIYYWFRGSLSAFLEFGLLYNFHYTSNWTVPIDNIWLGTQFELLNKGLWLVFGLLLTTYLSFIRSADRKLIWLSWWSWLALFAALLSNRPYPHYFLQLVPPLSLLAAAWLFTKSHWYSKLVASLPILFSAAALILLQFKLYPFVDYYHQYLKLVTGQISQTEYHQQFNSLVGQNEVMAQTIIDNSFSNDRLFVWGTNPMLYALTKRVPASKFTVAFHIHDLYAYQNVLQEVKLAKPSHIVVMKNETSWPDLNEYLGEHYLRSVETEDMILYRRSTLTSLMLIQ